MVVKQLAGGDEFSGRDLYKKNDPFVFNAMPILLCNEMPKMTDRSYAMMRRIIPLPFEAKFVACPKPENPCEKLMDPYINDKFEAWKHVFASYLVDNRYKDLMRNEFNIVIPKKVEDFRLKYQKDTDYIADFLHERFEITKRNEDYLSFAHVWPFFSAWFKSICPSDPVPNRSRVQKNINKSLKLQDVETVRVPKDGSKGDTPGWRGVKMIVPQV